MNRICVIGGANVDICATPFLKLIEKDSNPGKVTYSLGGVARNVAENLALLGRRVEFITALGQDRWAEAITDKLMVRNIGFGNSLRVDQPTSVYAYITDERGEMQLAVSDMDILNKLDKDALYERLEVINSCDSCFIDTNLNRADLTYLMENVKCPLFLDAVSVNKVYKLKGIVNNLYCFKPNLIEAEALAERKIHDYDELPLLASDIIKMGVREVFISLGADGVFCADENSCSLIPCVKGEVVNTTGAGDALMASLIWGHAMGFDIEKKARMGMIAAKLCLSSERTVFDGLSAEKVISEYEARY
ncbi:MAG: PfkB family carbohydrate kinase [Clostridia bacterium]|nr:PfkB family carbohydrate kinase [Clostridia bacterium]